MNRRPLIDDFRGGFPAGFTPLTREGDPDGDTGVDLGILKLGDAPWGEASPKESVFLLVDGAATIRWSGGREEVSRRSLFDEAPFVLNVPRDVEVTIEGASEWALARTTNERVFPARFYRPADVPPEYRGAGLAQGACLRNVRTVFDNGTREDSNLVVGEVVNFPGRWSSYPPHTHPQPEIYHYRFSEPAGFGHAELSEQVFKVRSGDTLKILDGATHAQVSAPGYAMYYIWIVRHLEGARYTGFTFEEAHRWVLDPARQGWQPPV